jgi:hypothetical protein
MYARICKVIRKYPLEDTLTEVILYAKGSTDHIDAEPYFSRDDIWHLVDTRGIWSLMIQLMCNTPGPWKLDERVGESHSLNPNNEK